MNRILPNKSLKCILAGHVTNRRDLLRFQIDDVIVWMEDSRRSQIIDDYQYFQHFDNILNFLKTKEKI